MIGKHVAYGQRTGDTPQAIDEQTHDMALLLRAGACDRDCERMISKAKARRERTA